MDQNGAEPAPPRVVLDGETLRRVNEQQGYRYRQRQKYLQEDDRVEIIRRLLAGEKQSNLAREFGVTRAAVCNTFKNREEILARSRHVFDAQCARAARAPPEVAPSPSPSAEDKREPEHAETLGTHAPTRRIEDGPGSTRSDARGPVTSSKRRRRTENEDVDNAPLLHHGALQQEREPRGTRSGTGLPTRLVDSERQRGSKAVPLRRRPRPNDGGEPIARAALSPVTRIRECASPSARSLIARLRDNTAPPGQFRTLADRLIRLLLNEVSESQPCVRGAHSKSCQGRAVAVGIGNGGYPLLRSYQTLHPDQAVGLIRFDADGNTTSAVEVSLPHAARSACTILLMTSESISGTTVCRAIDELLLRGVSESSILVVAVFLSHHAIARLQHLFPAVDGFVAAVGDSGDALAAPGRLVDHSSFLDRYYHADAAREEE